MSSHAGRRLLGSALVALLVLAAGASGQLTAEQQAKLLLDGAKRAYNEKNYPFATARFREFLQKHGGHRDVASARFGLALCLLEGNERDPDKAMEQLSQLLPQKTFPEYAFVHYYAGLARRAQGVKAEGQASARPELKNTAKQRFDESAKQFSEASSAFLVRAKEAKAPEKGLPEDLEWAIRSRCDQAEMLLRLRKAKEAREAVASFATDKEWAKSRYHSLGRYYDGFASFLLGDMPAAGKALSLTNVLTDEVFGTHARYLLGRVHHQNTKQDEREEARQAYQTVLKDHDAAKKAAQSRLGKPLDPDTKARLERLARGPTPDHVARAAFFLGVLQYEDGRFSEALEHLKNFATLHPTSPLLPEARLRMGYCQVQLKQLDDAIKTLQPLADKEPALADQALYQIARARLAKVDEKKPEYKPAIEAFKKAAERAGQQITSDASARGRRGEALTDLAEVYLLAKQPRDAASTYSTILQEKLLPDRDDETTLNLAAAYQIDGDLAESEKSCTRFLEKFKDSTLLPAVLFRQAENSSLSALKAEMLPDAAARARELTKSNDEAIKRYSALLAKYPEYAQAHRARQGLGTAHYRKGELEQAQKAFEAIPAMDRSGDLASVSYCLADIYLRQAPARTDDAVSAGRAEEKLKAASELLDGFIAVAPDAPQTPDALLKLGYCHQRMAKLLAMPAEQKKSLTAARAAYERVQQKYKSSAAYPQATFERGKVLVPLKEVNPAIEELKKFAVDETLRKSTVAPTALLHLATVYRSLNRPADAVATLAECRKRHDSTLLQYHHAVALREAGKLDDARQLFETVARTDRPEGWDAALRAGLCQKDGAEKKLTDGRKLLPDSSKRVTGEKMLAEGTEGLRSAVSYLTTQEKALRDRKPASEEGQKALAQVRGRMMYESAWGWRALAELEVEAARRKLQQDRWQKRRDEVAKQTPPGQTPPPVAMPEVALADVPRQPAEEQVRSRYQELIKTFSDLTLNADARFELAEVLCQRDEHDQAIKLLQGALEGEKEPSPELTERIKLRLGTCLLERGSRKMLGDKKDDGRKDIDAALEQLQPVAGNEKGPLLAQAVYREAECQLQLGKLDEAIKLLTRFRDHGPFQTQVGVTDRALLRLGWALSEKKQWDASRQAYETLVARFPGSPWRHEARYGIGWALHNQGRFDEAVGQYAQVSAATATRLGARAQLNVGLCRLSQKRYADASTALLVVPFTYDYPDLSALALLEAARSLSESKQNDQAAKLLKRVLRDHAGSAHAEAARKKLTELGES